MGVRASQHPWDNLEVLAFQFIWPDISGAQVGDAFTHSKNDPGDPSMIKLRMVPGSPNHVSGEAPRIASKLDPPHSATCQ